MECDICGEKHSTVEECADGLRRCTICRNRAIYGKPYITEGERYSDEAEAAEEAFAAEAAELAALEIGASR